MVQRQSLAECRVTVTSLRKEHDLKGHKDQWECTMRMSRNTFNGTQYAEGLRL